MSNRLSPEIESVRKVVITGGFWLAALCLSLLLSSAAARAQSCDDTGTNGGESIEASVSIDSTGAPVTSEMVVPSGTKLRLDALATAYGECQTTYLDCTTAPCKCSPLNTYNRTVNHISVWANVSAEGLNGQYSIGNVYGKNSNGTTAFYNELDTRNANSSGPIYVTVKAGVYEFHFVNIINKTPCYIEPFSVETVVTVTVKPNDDAENNGVYECASVGRPVNVTNGNMYVQQADYRLPGAGGGLDITRTYNSNSKRVGLFGLGWTTLYDESVTPYGALTLRLTLSDGRAVFFTRDSEGEPFAPRQPLDFHGQIVRNADGSYTLTHKDGRVHQFNASGKLVSLTDRNNNQTLLTYDANGKLVTVTDPAGRVVTLAYGANGLVSSVSDALGTAATYAYTTGSRLATVTYPDNSQYKFTYGVTQNRYVLTVVKDALNNILEAHAYDSLGRATTSEIHGGAEKYTLAYVGPNETRVTDALGHVTKYFFDKSRGRNVVTRVEGDCGCGGSRVETWAYDDQLNVTAKTDALDHTYSYTYDAEGNRLTESGPLGTTTYTYNPFGQVLTETDPLGGVTTYTYDAAGNLTSVKDALNNTTSFTHTPRGQLQSMTDARSNRTEFTYDAAGNLVERKDAGQNVTTYAYDARGRLAGVTDALNHVTAYEYDAAGRVKKVTRPDNTFVTYTYDLAGRRTKVTDARNNSTSYTYDGAYRLTKVTDAADKTVTYAYDLMSNLTGETDQLGRTTNYEYDDFDRVTKIIYPEAEAGAGRLFETFEYDANGNLTKRTDAAGRATTYEYDTADRLAKVTDPAAQATRYEYNARSEVVAVVDALDQRYAFAYDELGRVTEVTRGGLSMTYGYDAAGNRVERRDYNGAVTTYAYDALNRLTGVAYPDATGVAYGYDALGRLVTAANQHGAVTVGYDGMGRIQTTTDVWGQAVGYSYDANDNRSELRLGSTVKATYQYDALDRLTQLADGGVFTHGYDTAGRLTSRTAPNGVTMTNEYDGLGRLKRLRHAKGAATVADFQYQFNPTGNITQVTDQAGTHAYGYDLADRLTSATHPSLPAESYAYDGVGNRTSSHRATTYQYQPFNRVVTIGSVSYSYDANGNLTSKTDSSGNWQYVWDYENRLVQVWRPDGLIVTYKYDALGRRVETSRSTGTWTRYSYDGTDVVLDRHGDGGITEYANGLGIDEKLWQRAGGGSTLYFVQDHLGSTRALADASGNVVEGQQYDSFGDGAGSALTRYGYTGRELDADTGLMYYRARWYDPQQGRFISEDPIGFEGGVNWYAYVDNNPPNFTDPLGLYPPSHPYCQSLRRRIENIKKEIAKRRGERHEDKLRLPWRAPGDKQKPSISRWGHEMLINKLKAQKAALEAQYSISCNDPEPPKPTTCPVPSQKRLPGPTQEELDLQAESARQYYEFWKKITLGGYLVGGVLTGGALFGGGAAAGAGGLIPVLVP